MNYFTLEQIFLIKKEFEKNICQFNIVRYKINELEEVVVLNDSLVLFIGIEERTVLACGALQGTKYYSLHIEEITYNELGFKYTHTTFINKLCSKFNTSYINHTIPGAEGSYIGYTKFRGINKVYWSNIDSLPIQINKTIPELDLLNRYKFWEGIHYYFIILELNYNNIVNRCVAYTQNKPHDYIISFGRKFIKSGNISNDIRNSFSFIEALKNMKGIPRKERLEKYMTYFSFEKYFREKDDVWRYADILLEKINNGEIDITERCTYTKPSYKWVTEELVLNIIRKLYKNYTVIYQYKPFFLRSSFGGQMSYDIFIQELNVAIEYQGQQHFEPIEYFGGVNAFEKTKIRDKEKKELSDKHNIKLIYINYDEVISPDLIQNKINFALKNY